MSTVDERAAHNSFWMTYCPDWCHGQHEQALAEGCSPEGAAVHWGPECTGSLPDIANPTTQEIIRGGGGGWDAWLVFDPCGWKKEQVLVPVVQLTIQDVFENGARRNPDIVLPLTSGEARTFARQLNHLADLMDLDG